MKLTPKKIAYHSAIKTCKNCENSFQGKICNNCGEKVFDEKNLTAKHFLHEAIDFFYHWESKVLKTIKLNFLRPGFVTKKNLEGIRVPFAKPVQLYLVVAFAFFLILSLLKISDYIPSYGDQEYYSLSQYSVLKWAKPIDQSVEKGIENLWIKKGLDIQNNLQGVYENYYFEGENYVIPGRKNEDSITLNKEKLKVYSFRQATFIRSALFDAKVGTYGKILILLLIPIFALFFFLIFYKKIKYYGASLILATHFMVYNLCIYVLWSTLIYLPERIGLPAFKGWLYKPIDLLFYNRYVEQITNFISGSSFEFVHIIFFFPWLYICFKRLFELAWWKNIIVSFLLSRIFFYLIFGVLKKFVIAFTVWSMHY